MPRPRVVQEARYVHLSQMTEAMISARGMLILIRHNKVFKLDDGEAEALAVLLEEHHPRRKKVAA